jgi:hypothetical protein
LHFQKQAKRRHIYTHRLLKEELNSTHYSQSTIHKARDLGLIDRVEGEPPGPSQFPPVYNKTIKAAGCSNTT